MFCAFFNHFDVFMSKCLWPNKTEDRQCKLHPPFIDFVSLIFYKEAYLVGLHGLCYSDRLTTI